MKKEVTADTTAMKSIKTAATATATADEESTTTSKKASEKAFLSVSSDKKPYEKITAKDTSSMSEAELSSGAVKKAPVTNGENDRSTHLLTLT